MRPHRPQRSPGLISMRFTQTVGALLPFSLLATVRSCLAWNSMADVDFGGVTDRADGATVVHPHFLVRMLRYE